MAIPLFLKYAMALASSTSNSVVNESIGNTSVWFLANLKGAYTPSLKSVIFNLRIAKTALCQSLMKLVNYVIFLSQHVSFGISSSSL